MDKETLYAPRFARWAGGALIIIVALLYLFTLDNGFRPGELEGGDLITHQYAQVQARPSNAPGYPLYTMGGWLWFHTVRNAVRLLGDPLPNPIPILSSYSTIFALLALGLLYAVLLETLPVATQDAASTRRANWPLAWLITAFYAVTYFFWYYAVTTEQYSSAVAQTLAIVYVYFLWRRQSPVSNPQSHFTHRDRLLVLLAFLCGLSLAHMLTVAFIIPPLVIAIVWEQPGLLRRGRLILAVIAAALLPLISYVYVYLRGAAHPEWWGEGAWSDSWSWFWSFVSTAQGRAELAWGFEPGRAFWGNGFPELIWQELSIPLFVIGLVGIAFLGRKPAIVLYGALILYAIFCWMYRYGNWFQVILPVYPLLLIGAAAAINRFQWSQSAMRSRFLHVAPLVLLAIAIIWRFAESWPQANNRNRPTDTALDRPALLLDQPLPQNARLFAASSDVHGLDYLTNIWGIRPDMQVVSSEEAGRWLVEGRPVLSTWEMASTLLDEIPATLKPELQTRTADWVAATTTTLTALTPQVAWSDRISDSLTLVGYTISPGPTGAPVTTTAPSLDVTLFWRLAEGEWPEGLAISVRPTLDGAFIPALADSSGVIIQQDAAAPMHGLWQKARPSPDTVIADAYRLILPGDGNANGVMVLLYRVTEQGFATIAELRLSVANQ